MYIIKHPLQWKWVFKPQFSELEIYPFEFHSNIYFIWLCKPGAILYFCVFLFSKNMSENLNKYVKLNILILCTFKETFNISLDKTEL